MRHRHAVSLVELLVVIGIIGIMLSLLLPAIQAARSAARRIECTNNLKQLGAALHHHHSAYGAFPPGNAAVGASSTEPTDVGGGWVDGPNWMILILPYVERKSLHQIYDFESSNQSPQNRSVRESFVATFVCPSDANADSPLVPATGPGAAGALDIAYMPGSYRAVSGRSDGFRFLDSQHVANYPREWRGVMHVSWIEGFEPETVGDIRDGTSHTLMVGDAITRSNSGYGTLWACSNTFYSLSAATPQSRTLLGDFDRCVQLGGVGGQLPCMRGWGSYHNAGSNFLLCDGSARFLSQSIKPELFARLATIAGRMPASVPVSY